MATPTPITIVAALLALLPPANAVVCYPEYQSIFHWLPTGANGRTDLSQNAEYSYDFRPLCGGGPSGGDNNFTLYTPEGYRWEILWTVGGNVSARCNPNWPHGFSGGSVIQFWSTSPGGTTKDPESGKTVPITADCEILGHTRPEFDLVDETNPATGGVILRHSSLPPMQGDPFGCPTDPRTGYPRERSLDMILLCDPSMSLNDITPVSFVEVKPTGLGTCQYAFTLRTGAACGIAGDPFDAVAVTTGAGAPAYNFGFTVLGAFLFVGFQFAFTKLHAGGHLGSLMSSLRGKGASSSGGFSKIGSGSGGSGGGMSSASSSSSSSSYGSYWSA